MPNIAIINECNLKCPYCFADEMIDGPKKKYMTPEEFIEILEFILKDPGNDRRIGIIGGEPTLHPQIGEILTIARDFALQHDFHVTIFTNGIHLDRIIPFITRDLFGVLVNVNSPKIIGEDSYNRIQENLAYVYEVFGWRDKVSIGVNVYQELQDYTFIADTVKRFELPSVRFSVVAPTYKDHARDKEIYYQSMRDLQLQVCRMIFQAGAIVRFDCNHVPDCYYTPEEQEEIQKYTSKDKSEFCFGPIDITVDRKAVRCFGVYSPVDVFDFGSLRELKNYFLFNGDFVLYNANKTGRCANCKKNKTMKCSGGCYVFAKTVLNREEERKFNGNHKSKN